MAAAPVWHIGILLFHGVEELDAVGPWRVLAYWTQQHPKDGYAGGAGVRVAALVLLRERVMCVAARWLKLCEAVARLEAALRARRVRIEVLWIKSAVAAGELQGAP